MAPLADNFTAMIKVQYRAAGATHWALGRYARGVGASTMESDFFPALRYPFFQAGAAGQLVEDFQWLQTQVRGEDQTSWIQSPNVPVAVTTGDVALSSLSAARKATHTKFTARGGGRTANLTLFGIVWDLSDVTADEEDGIIFSSENTLISGTVAALNAAVLVTISNESAIWKGQANIKVNDYWRNYFKRA